MFPLKKNIIILLLKNLTPFIDSKVNLNVYYIFQHYDPGNFMSFAMQNLHRLFF